MSNIPPLPQTPPPSATDLARVVNALLEGRINSVGTVTLTNGGTTTTLYDNHANPSAAYFFFPQTANAAAITSFWYDPSSITINVPGGTGGSITLHHSSSANSDLTFGYIAFT